MRIHSRFFVHPESRQKTGNEFSVAYFEQFQKTLMWNAINPRIRQASEEIAKTHKFDDAIFAAFRYIEGEIQERISSNSIGKNLLDEAFDGTAPKILLSSESRDQSNMKNLFVGALGNIRNDRGHKKEPAIPCESLTHCLYYLNFASLLLYLLDKDKNTYPRLESVRLFGTPDQPRAELRGANFTSGSQVLAEGIEARIVSARPELLEVLLPSQFHGNLQVVYSGKASDKKYCSVAGLDLKRDTFYEVIAADLTLYADKEGLSPRNGIVGLILRTVQGHGFEMVVPTYPGRYKAGEYVSHGPFESNGLPETWYIRPPSTKPELAFSSSVIVTPDILGMVANETLAGIGILPPAVKTEVGENRALRVVAWTRAGTITFDRDVTSRVTWNNPNPESAFVGEGTCRPKQLGKTVSEASLDGFIGLVEITVENIPRGLLTVFFQGLRDVQKIRFDADDNLYVCNQSASVFKISTDGQFSEIFRLPAHPRAAAVIDSLAVDRQKRLYVNHVAQGKCHRFEWDGKKYGNERELGSKIVGTKKSITIDHEGNIFIAVMAGIREGFIVRMDPSGTESHFRVPDTAIYIAVDANQRLYIPLISKSIVGVFDYAGNMITKIPYFLELGQSPSDIWVSANGDIYLSIHNGRILHIPNDSNGLSEVQFLPGSFGVPGGLAFDSKGRMFVSNSQGNEIWVVY